MKTKYDLLNNMLEEMEKQSPLFKPTNFWEYGAKLIIDDLESNGIENFRTLNAPRSFFVPGYAHFDYLTNIKKYDSVQEKLKEITSDERLASQLKKLFSGYSAAFSDYRVLKASNIDKIPYTDKVSESRIGNPIEQFTFDDRNFSRTFLNYLLGLNFLKQNLDTSKIRNVMEVGGGFGTLGEILLGDERNKSFYINVDIPPVSFVSSYYLEEVFGPDNIANYNDLRNLDTLNISDLRTQYKALNICSWQIQKLVGTIDLFVNFISFQEMEPDVVENYCYYIDKLETKYVLLRNILEGKRKKSDTHPRGVMKPILGADYNEFLPNYELICTDFSIFGFTTEDNFHSQLRLYKRKYELR